MSETTGWVACTTDRDMLVDVAHGEIHGTEDEAIADARANREAGSDLTDVRWVGEDGHLYVERPEAE